MQPIHNEVTNSAFPTTEDSRHAGTLVSNQRKRTRENVQAISVASEDASSKRIRHPTAIVGDIRPLKVMCGSGEGCSSSHNGGSSPVYDDLGDCDQQCRYCGPAFWYGERLKGNSNSRRPDYHLCCGGGKIYMQPEPDPPEYIKRLLQNKHFMENIRAYNQMFDVCNDFIRS